MNIMAHQNGSRRRSWMVAAGLVAAAWVGLAAWCVSPFAEWLDHSRIEQIAAPAAVRLAVFTGGWALMVIAMMLPVTLLLLERCVPARPLRDAHVAPVITTYVAVWTAFGSLSYVADSALHEIVEQAPALAGLIAPSLLLLAGVYQLTPLKQAALARCRREGTVFACLATPERGTCWIVGLRHAVFCVASCWALMLLLMAGGASLIWMLVLGMLMAAERLTARGVQIARLLGVLLLVWWAVSVL